MTEAIKFGEMWICPTCGRLTSTRVSFRVGIVGRDYCEMCEPNTPLEALFDVVMRPYLEAFDEETADDVHSPD